MSKEIIECPKCQAEYVSCQAGDCPYCSVEKLQDFIRNMLTDCKQCKEQYEAIINGMGKGE